jgi:DNA polymerase-3 subunit epsilon
MKAIFFDLETTGLSPAKNGIHQISGCIEIDGKVIERFNFKVRPNEKCVIEDSALEVGGVTKEQVMAYPPMKTVYNDFIEMITPHCDKFNKKDKFFLIGYNNASFDNQFLRGFFLQNDDKYFGSWFWSNSIDVMVLASEFLKIRRPEMPDFKLKTVAAELGFNVDETKLHDANYDIELTRSIYKLITFSK